MAAGQPARPQYLRLLTTLVHRASIAVSREQFPGCYEKGADIATGRWHQLRLEVHAARVRALVDVVEVLLVDDLRHPHQQGAVGLWIGDGIRVLFKNLNVVS